MKAVKNIAAIVTGAGSGMGAATAERLAKAGAKVALLDMNLAAAEKVAKAINGFAVQCDVSSSASAEHAIAQAAEVHGVARICVNCAGIAPAQRIVGREGVMPLEEFKKVIEVNLIGTFNILRLVAQRLSECEPLDENGERGVIINTASISAFEGQIGQAAYSASKGGVVGMTLACARDLAKLGIRVMTIAPGIMHTPMIAAMPENVQRSLAEQMPFPHRLGQADEFAALAMHIIENQYLNGETIRLDAAIRMQPK